MPTTSPLYRVADELDELASAQGIPLIASIDKHQGKERLSFNFGPRGSFDMEDNGINYTLFPKEPFTKGQARGDAYVIQKGSRTATDVATKAIGLSLSYMLTDEVQHLNPDKVDPRLPSNIGDCRIACELGEKGIKTSVSGSGLIGIIEEHGLPDAKQVSKLIAKSEDLLQTVNPSFKAQNADRANNGAAAMKAYIGASGKQNEPLVTNMKDMLTDLMHFANKKGLDFHACLASAVEHHKNEHGSLPAPVSLERLQDRLAASPSLPDVAAVQAQH
jgi:hypothetical protein